MRARAEPHQPLPDALRQRLLKLGGRLPGYAFVLGAALRRRSVTAAYGQALAREAGFGRLPVAAPGRALPGFRGLGRVAVIGVVLHVLLRQSGGGWRRRGLRLAGLSLAALRHDAGTLIALARWAVLGLVARRARLRTGV